MKRLDDALDWQVVALSALSLGAFHATICEKRLTSKELWVRLSTKFGGLTGRRFHQSALRKIYGNSYDGISKVREAKARGL